jgi:hypothetical protein
MSVVTGLYNDCTFSIIRNYYQGLGEHDCNISTKKTELRGLRVRGQPGLQSEFEVNLGWPASKNQNKKMASHGGINLSLQLLTRWKLDDDEFTARPCKFSKMPS